MEIFNLKEKFQIKSLADKMLEVESYMEWFKEAISKRFERYDEKFYGIEIYLSESKRRLRNLEMARDRSDDNEDIELQHVNDILFYLYAFFKFE